MGNTSPCPSHIPNATTIILCHFLTIVKNVLHHWNNRGPFSRPETLSTCYTSRNATFHLVHSLLFSSSSSSLNLFPFASLLVKPFKDNVFSSTQFVCMIKKNFPVLVNVLVTLYYNRNKALWWLGLFLVFQCEKSLFLKKIYIGHILMRWALFSLPLGFHVFFSICFESLHHDSVYIRNSI